MSIKISPSVLSADLTKLGEQAKAAEIAGADWLHIDVMDGSFVPWLTFGAPIVKALDGITDTPLDVHLLTDHPHRLIPELVSAGADIITVQAEACPHLHNTIHQIKDLGVKAGVALNPATSLSSIEYILNDLDLVMILAVDPGYVSMTPFAESKEKVAQLRKMLDERNLSEIEIQVDGGIKANNIAEYVAAGATAFVAGSAIFNQKASVAENMAVLRKNAAV
ncbi:MAG: ribulose-phosphate 3-epimerase [Chloroflexi bacterium]|nr:MAG: ribulose-phosphate 3-epimerase [Chloroflexota bacterium]